MTDPRANRSIEVDPLAIPALAPAYATKDSKVQSLNLIRIAIKAAMKEGPEMNQQLGGVIAELTDES